MSPKKLAAKIAEAALEIGPVEKGGVNSFYRYRYATEEDIVSAVRGALLKRGVIVWPHAVEVIGQTDVQGKQTVQRVLTLRTTYHITDGTETLVAQEVSEGADALDKGSSKASTGGYKYFLRHLLMIQVGGEDSEDDSRQHPPQPPPHPVDRRPEPRVRMTPEQERMAVASGLAKKP